MFTRSVLSMFVPVCLVGLSAAASAGSVAAPPSASDTRISVGADREVKTWYFSGTVRYIDDRTGKEDYMTFSGITAEMSRDQAMEFAKESGAAQGARWGRVVSVNVSTLF
jgi:hypothetical protein